MSSDDYRLWDDEDDETDLREVTRRYLPQTVVWTTDWTTGSLLEQMSRGVFDLEPPFQRRSAWTDKRASLYIESLLLGCPVPAITLAEMPLGSPNQYVVIDGKQRLTSLRRFAASGDLRLKGLEILTQFSDAKFEDIKSFPELMRFENLPIRTVIVRNWEKDEVLHFVFHRLNTQVTPLSTHELRRSLIPGPFTSYLDTRSAESRQLRRVLNIDEPDYRLRDAELLLRGIAFSVFLESYAGNLKRFQDQATRQLNAIWTDAKDASPPPRQQQVEAAAADIEATIDLIYDIFGDTAFQRLDDGGQPVGRFNRAVYDTHVIVFRDSAVRQTAGANPQAVRDAYTELFGHSTIAGYFESTTKTKKAVIGRSQAWADLLSSALSITIAI